MFGHTTAASDFSIKEKKISEELNSCGAGKKNFTVFEQFFEYFEFAMSEFVIAYHKMKGEPYNLNDTKAKDYVVEKYFDGELLKNHYEIAESARKRLEEIFNTTVNNYKDTIRELRSKYNNDKMLYFPSDPSAAYHYRKHGVKDLLDHEQQEIEFETYLSEAYYTIHNGTPSPEDQNIRIIKEDDYEQIAVISKNSNKTIISYRRKYK